MVDCVCLECGVEFHVPKSRIKNNRGKFCSRKCQGKWNGKNRIGNKHPMWNGGKIQKICIECNKPFNIDTYIVRNGNGKFCSRICLGKWRSKNLIKENSAHWKGGNIIKKCEECGKTYNIIKARLFTSKFCSLKCRANNKRDKNTPIIKFIRQCTKMMEWRTNIFIRDNYQDVYTKETGKLNAHHIKPLSKIIKDNNIISIDMAMSCEEIWDINNGITLTKNNHRKLHCKNHR